MATLLTPEKTQPFRSRGQLEGLANPIRLFAQRWTLLLNKALNTSAHARKKSVPISDIF